MADPRAVPTAYLLLPRTLEGFIQYDQAMDLLRSPAVHAIEPARMPYGAFGRMPIWLAEGLAGRQAKRLKLPGAPKAIAMFHPFQYPLARALAARHGAELWYMLWDRYEHAYDATAAQRERLRLWHDLALERSALTFAVTETLVDLEQERGHVVHLAPSAADSFPAPDPTGTVVAVALGHVGWRYDWRLLREIVERMPELVVLMIGSVAEDQVKDDPDYAACRDLANLVWLGYRPADEAARLILCADAGVLPFKVDPFNDAGIPNRILKAARLGRRTVTPMLSGVMTYREAVVRADDAAAWVAALRAERGTRVAPHLDVRAWALAMTAERIDAVLWRRLRSLGVEVPAGAGDDAAPVRPGDPAAPAGPAAADSAPASS